MPCTHSKTHTEAIRNGEEAIEMYLEAWQSERETIIRKRKKNSRFMSKFSTMPV
jgi:predicted RNase H-like HicB family nuclease